MSYIIIIRGELGGGGILTPPIHLGGFCPVNFRRGQISGRAYVHTPYTNIVTILIQHTVSGKQCIPSSD